MDVETSRPTDLLPDREASSLAAWLAQRPGIEVVCRDCAPFSAEGATAGAPQTTQVADRWHWRNLGEAAERAVARRLDDEDKPYLDERWDEGRTNAWKLWEGIVPLGYRGGYGPRQRLPAREAHFASASRGAAAGASRGDEVDPPPTRPDPTRPDPTRDADRDRTAPAPRRTTPTMARRSPPGRPAQPPHSCGRNRPRPRCGRRRTHLAWNSGVVEGHVNRIKMLKRHMSGRVGFQLLRKRGLLAP
ncbi:transposase [Streptomyces sp. NPDC029674]|uniref:transposase n=1 Tax=Streptomyces sp. NPDC029674 TaxID=3365297 RepID=UPI00384D4696